jgi:hypothetical protein
MKHSKTFHPLEEAEYNTLMHAVSCGYSGVVQGYAMDSLKQPGYTVTISWLETPPSSHWPACCALLVRDNTQEMM